MSYKHNKHYCIPSLESLTKDELGRANSLKCAKLRVHNGRAYLMFRIRYEDAISSQTFKELQAEGWVEYHSHALKKDLIR